MNRETRRRTGPKVKNLDTIYALDLHALNFIEETRSKVGNENKTAQELFDMYIESISNKSNLN